MAGCRRAGCELVHRPAVRGGHRAADAASHQAAFRGWPGGAGRRGGAMRRAVITGIGAVTPIGHGAKGLWAGVLANQSAVKAIDRFDASPFPSRIAAQIDDFVPSDHLDARRARRLDRFSQLTVAAARMAVEHAGLPMPDGRADRTGIWIGSALGG